MRNWIGILVIAATNLSGFVPACRGAAATARDKQAGEGELVRWHFVGSAAVAKDTNSVKLREIWKLPATQELREATLRKLAAFPWLEDGGSDLLRPLLEDVIGEESAGRVKGGGEKPVTWMVAVRLSDERAKLWQANLEQAISRGGKNAVKTKSVSSYAVRWAKLSGGASVAGFARAGQWMVVGRESEDLPLLGKALSEIKETGRPIREAKEHWLEVEADLAALIGPAEVLPSGQWPQTQITIGGNGEYVRTTGHLRYAERRDWKTEPWVAPTNTISEPLVSFTAVQGIAPWVESFELMRKLDSKPMPNQVYVWAQGDVPFQTFVAAPMAKAANRFEQIAARLPGLVNSNLMAEHIGQIKSRTNDTELFLQGWPIMLPFLRPLREIHGELRDSEFLYGGLFPASPGAKPAPGELIAQLAGRTNLLYYDWEITEVRISQWRQISQLTAMLTPGAPNFAEQPALKWLDAVAAKLGNSVTEVTAISPQELSLTRKSHSGFTAVELLLLSQWLDKKDFPNDSPGWPFRSKAAAGKTGGKK